MWRDEEARIGDVASPTAILPASSDSEGSAQIGHEWRFPPVATSRVVQGQTSRRQILRR